MAIVVKKAIEEFGKDRIYKRWLLEDEVIIESHVTLLRKIGRYEHDIIRYDLDTEGSHIHLKLFGMDKLSLKQAQKIVKSFDKWAGEILEKFEQEIKS